MRAVTVDDPARGEVTIGHIHNDVFIKDVERYKHFMRMYRGYAIQKETVDKFKKVRFIEIIEDKRKRYRIPVDEFRRHAIEFDEGHGAQYVVDEEHYKDYRVKVV